MLNRNYILILIISTYLFAQDDWGGVSVATPDNLNAIASNPAGLGIPRGHQSGMYFPFDSVFTIYKSRRIKGFGYDLKYEFIDQFFDEKDEDFEAAALEKTVKYPMN